MTTIMGCGVPGVNGMTFHPVSIGSQTFNQSGPAGRYVLSTLAFGDPDNSIRISGGTYNKKTGFTNATVSRLFEVDVTEGGIISRRRCTVSLSIQVPKGVPSAAVDLLVGDISTFITETTLNRLLNGEQ